METILEKTSVEAVQESYGRCLSNGDIIQTFYDIFLKSSPEIAPKFKNTDFENQKKLLRHGINLMIMYAAGNIAGTTGLSRLQKSHSHSRLDIKPDLYKFWKESLLEAVSRHDRNITPQLKRQWEELLNVGIKYITSGY